MGGFSLLIFNAVLVLLYVGAILAVKEERMKLFVISLFPTVDIVSDFNYVATTRYYNVILFVFSLISIFLAAFLFLRKLVSLPNPSENGNRIANPYMIFNSYPGFKFIDNRLIWFEMETGVSTKGETPSATVEHNTDHHSHPGYPKGSDMLLRGIDTSNHDSIVKLLVFVLCWVLMVVFQVISLVAFFMWLLVAPVFCLLVSGWCSGVSE